MKVRVVSANTPAGSRVGGGTCWMYACSGCRRISGPYFTAAAAESDASSHDCASPRAHERTDPTGTDPAFAEVMAAAWATLLDDPGTVTN